MRPAIALAALFMSACAGASADSSTVPTGPSLVGDSCAVARPNFGGVATAADRNLFAYDVNAPLNLQMSLESTSKGVEGIPVRTGEHALVADSPTAFAEAITSAVDDPAGMVGLARNARRLVADGYDWAALGERFARLLTGTREALRDGAGERVR